MRRTAGREDRHVSLGAVDEATAQAMADRLSDSDGRMETARQDACRIVQRELASLNNPLHGRCAELWLMGESYESMAE